MRPKIINDDKLLELIDVKKLSQAETAKELGVTRQAISKRLNEIRGIQAKVRVYRKADSLVETTDRAKDELWRKYSELDDILAEAQEEKDRGNSIKAIEGARKIIKDLLEFERQDEAMRQFRDFSQQFLLLLTEIKRNYPDAYKFIREEINSRSFLGSAIKLN